MAMEPFRPMLRPRTTPSADVRCKLTASTMQLAYRSLTVLDQLLTEAENNAQVREQELRRPPVSPRDTPVVPIAANWISEESDLARQARMVNARDVTIAKNASIMAARNSARRVQSGAAELQFYRRAQKQQQRKRGQREAPGLTQALRKSRWAIMDRGGFARR